MPDGIDRESVALPDGQLAIWPVRPDGTESLWGLTPDVLRRNWAKGYVRVNWNAQRQMGTPYYLPTGTIQAIERGEIAITGRSEDGSVVGFRHADFQASTPPKQVWNMRSHNAETGGTNMLSAMLRARRFPFPKSLYAVEDTLRFFVKGKPNAVVLDFFAGSGTTAHAVMRLNKQDCGRRQCISVTNNEVSAEEDRRLRLRGLRPGDMDWEALGICDYITKPRITAAITGLTPQGEPITGHYKFTEEFPMADGFHENATYFTMTYETPLTVRHHRAFARIAPLLWMRAGSEGRVITELGPKSWYVSDAYGVLANLDRAEEFLQAMAHCETVRLAYIVTDDETAFQMICRELPAIVTPVRLYESYLQNFEINMGRSL